MCWQCGRIRPYDTPEGWQRIGDTYSFVTPGGETVTAVEFTTTDEETILSLIDMGIVGWIDGDSVGWEQLSKYPPIDSPFFKSCNTAPPSGNRHSD